MQVLTFKQYISEAGSPRTVPISAKSAFETIDKHCQAFARSMSKQLIYRGGSGFDGFRTYHGNSNSGNPRKSANTANYFTLWHDNHPDWSEFPKRSRSFICSNDFDIANNFGDTHLLIPYDDAHIGVVPEEDLFGAITSPIGEDLSIFNTTINAVLDCVGKEYKLADGIETYKQLVDRLKLATLQVLEAAPINMRKYLVLEAIDHMNQYNAKTYLEVVDKCYSPKDFSQGKASSIKLPNVGCELYIQGEGVFLPYSELSYDRKKYTEEYIELLQLAVGKYNWNLDA